MPDAPTAQGAPDLGAPDPGVAAALAAFAAGEGSEHAVLAALAPSRLLVPVVAVLAGSAEDAGLRREKTTEMAMPTLIGHDGRPAVLAFSCLAALRRWQPDARPVPVPARTAWQAATTGDCAAVVIDVAGPVPFVVDGARLAELAQGGPVSPLHLDRDLCQLAGDALAAETVITGGRLWPGQESTDVTLAVTLAPGHTLAQPEVQAAIGRVAQAMMAGAGSRLRRGIAVTVASPDADAPPPGAS